VHGNFDRIGATLDAYSSGNFPPDPEVVQSPANGVGLTHRVAVHLRPGLPGAGEIRALRPADQADLAAAVGRISAQSLYRRFFGIKLFSEGRILRER
jgi:hypothetical protein